tara:strand:- start:13 stop:813 length:801 start_codon:yes stop_codon:yes gene_type:complete
MLKGIKVKESCNSTVCIVESFTDEIKIRIRENLNSICHGRGKVHRKSKLYSYERTLKDFLDRYERKTSKQKTGMIGELLSHIIILDVFTNLQSVNPYFNMEEKNVKKGFDLVLVDESENNKLWITEVKAGRIGKLPNSRRKNNALLSIAKNDLNTRLNESDQHLWQNAINGAMVSMKNNNLKSEIVDILEENLDDAYDDESSSTDKNVILTTVLFNDIRDVIKLKDVVSFATDTENESIFADIMVISVQKNTLEKVVEFLQSEVKK